MYTDLFAYLRGFHRGRRDALENQPPSPNLSGDFKVGYLLAYRCFAHRRAADLQHAN